MAAMEAKDSEAKVAGPSQQTALASTGDSELDQKVAEWLALDQVNTLKTKTSYLSKQQSVRPHLLARSCRITL